MEKVNGHAPFFSNFMPVIQLTRGGLNRSEWVDRLRFRHFFLLSSFVIIPHCSRLAFATPLLCNRRQSEVLSNIYRRPIEHLSKTYRRSIEHLSKTYRRPIEDLSKTYRRWGEEGAERERRGSRGRIWLQSYKITKSHFHLFGR